MKKKKLNFILKQNTLFFNHLHNPQLKTLLFINKNINIYYIFSMETNRTRNLYTIQSITI